MDRPMPFPLASGRYEISPGMRRFGQAGQGLPAEDGHFHPDANLPTTLAAKLALLQRAPHECHLVAPGLNAAEEANLRSTLRACFRLLADEHPDMATIHDDGVTLHHLGVRLSAWEGPIPRLEQVGEGWSSLEAVAPAILAYLAGRARLQLLGDALGLSAQEDLAIVRGPGPGAHPGGSDLLEWMHVCLPSNWAPAEKIGRNFGAVHEPVVHSEQLLASQTQIIRAMIHAGPFVRYVWALHRDAELCHNPRLHQAGPWLADATPEALAQQAFFRVERQTTHGFPGLNRGLFTIRYWVAHLTDVVADPWKRERLSSALAGMDEAELKYKGLTDARDKLVAWLDRLS
jgi:hypothetical protein